MGRPRIDVLMATYNGAAYLEEQIASLAAQDHADWHLLVRDDGSQDDTPAIVQRCSKQHGISCTWIEDGQRGLGACAAFGSLIAASTAPYFACCDQDDIWLPTRLSRMLEHVQIAEAQSGDDRPCLAFCDLVPVDRTLRPIAPSFRSYAGLHIPTADRAWRHLMIENFVTGCATLGNAALRRKAGPVPAQAMMHDWWLALVAATQGRLVDVPEPLVLYRQHGGNVLGAQRGGFTRAARRVFDAPVDMLTHARQWGQDAMQQACAFADRYEGMVAPQIAALYREFGDLPARGAIPRKSFVLRERSATNSTLRVLALAATI